MSVVGVVDVDVSLSVALLWYPNWKTKPRSFPQLVEVQNLGFLAENSRYSGCLYARIVQNEVCIYSST